MLITGTRKGIGKYLSEYYVKRGFRVVGCSRAAPDWSLDGYEHYGVDVAEDDWRHLGKRPHTPNPAH